MFLFSCFCFLSIPQSFTFLQPWLSFPSSSFFLTSLAIFFLEYFIFYVRFFSAARFHSTNKNNSLLYLLCFDCRIVDARWNISWYDTYVTAALLTALLTVLYFTSHLRQTFIWNRFGTPIFVSRVKYIPIPIEVTGQSKVYRFCNHV